MGFVESKYCNKCLRVVGQRLVKDGESSYYACKGCLQTNSKNHRKRHWYKYLAQKANARKRPNSIKLQESDILKLKEAQQNKCSLTGQIFDIESKWWKPSLDRIDSKLGYTLDNIRLVAWIVNHCRGDLSDIEFIDMCNKVSSK